MFLQVLLLFVWVKSLLLCLPLCCGTLGCVCLCVLWEETEGGNVVCCVCVCRLVFRV